MKQDPDPSIQWISKQIDTADNSKQYSNKMKSKIFWLVQSICLDKEMNTFGIFPSQQYLVKSGCLVACNAMSHRDSVLGYEFQVSESYNQR